MEIKLLKCFITVADELHFGRAAQQLDIMPSALGRNIRLLEEQLGIRVFSRTTRNVRLTRSGHILLKEVRPLINQMEQVIINVRAATAAGDRVFRVGAIDSAATGLIPKLLHDFRDGSTDLELFLDEDKTSKLLPKLLSGALDIAFVRPPPQSKENIHFEPLLYERIVVALPSNSHLAEKEQLTIYDLADKPLIVPSPRNRPHSYNLSNSLFLQAGLTPNFTQQAEEKHTIINLVGAEVGLAIIPYWTSKIQVQNVIFRPLVDKFGNHIEQLPLAAAWVKGIDDPNRSKLLKLLMDNLNKYVE